MTTRFDNIIPFPREMADAESASDVEAAAALWLARMTSGSPTLGELAEFGYWRAASREHDRRYGELEAMWDRLGACAQAPQGLRRRRLAGLPRPARLPGWALRLSQLAAAILVAVLVAQYMTIWRYDYHTAPGEIRHVALADGSTIDMKGGTALDAQVGRSGVRTIELARGEAFFEVRHDAARPFTVSVGSGVVRDVGTGFSVARSGRSATVAVAHGAVAVGAGGLSDMLTAGEQVSFNLYDMSRKLSVDTGRIAPWRRGLYIAEGKPLGEVLSDLGEYYPGQIIVTSPALAARRVNAVVQLGHIDALLDSLGETKGIAVHHWGPLTIVGHRQD